MTTAERESAIKKEIARARQYPPEFLAEYYMNMWLANDAELLRNELQDGLAGVAELLARDLQDATVVDKSSRPDKSTGARRQARRVPHELAAARGLAGVRAARLHSTGQQCDCVCSPA